MVEKKSEQNCYLCGSSTNVFYQFNKGISKGFSLIKCSNCELIRTLPIPELKKIKGLYSTKAQSTLIDKGEVFNSKLLEKLKKIFVIKPLLKELLVRCEFKDKRPNLLDIGCSTGWITSVARDIGFNVKGLEFNPDCAKIAREKYDLDIKEGLIEDISLDEKFDAVIMMHVLEHFIDPLDILQKIHKISSSEGKLLIVVPNTNSFSSQIFKKNYPWNVPRHLTFFTKSTLSKILEKAGYKVDKVSCFISTPLVLYSINTYLFAKFGFRINNAFIGNLIAFPFAFLSRIVGKSDVLAVYAKKVC